MPVSQGPLGAPHASRSSSHVAWTPAPWETMEDPAPVPEDPLRVTAGSSHRPPRRREGLAQRGPGAAGPQPGLAAAARRADRRSLPATPCDSPMRPPRGARLRLVSPEATSFLGVSSSLSRPACCPPDASRKLRLCKSLARESRPRALFGAAAGNTRTRAWRLILKRNSANAGVPELCV